jgi:TetR/AcrR family transcriptional regulator, mexJK operon transcriptional repressor
VAHNAPEPVVLRRVEGRRRLINIGGVVVMQTENSSSHRRGRPTADRVHEINRAILDAATRCFLASGYDGASMDAIATEAQVSKVTLYARYQKESLFQAVVEDRLTSWTESELERDWMPGTTLESRLRQRVEVLMVIGASKELRAFDRLLAAAPTKLAHGLRQVRYNHMIDLIEHDITEFTTADGKPARDSRRTASDILALLAGWFRMESMVGPVTERDAIAFGERAVDLFLAARAVW